MQQSRSWRTFAPLQNQNLKPDSGFAATDLIGLSYGPGIARPRQRPHQRAFLGFRITRFPNPGHQRVHHAPKKRNPERIAIAHHIMGVCRLFGGEASGLLRPVPPNDVSVSENSTRTPGVLFRDVADEIKTALPHSEFGGKDCRGRLAGRPGEDLSEIVCNECGFVLAYIVQENLRQVLKEMELRLGKGKPLN